VHTTEPSTAFQVYPGGDWEGTVQVSSQCVLSNVSQKRLTSCNDPGVEQYAGEQIST